MRGDLSEEEYQTLYFLYASYDSNICSPSLVVSLTAAPEVLRQRILARGRNIEKSSHSISYLQQLCTAFSQVDNIISGTAPIVQIDTSDKDPGEVLDLAMTSILRET